LNLCPSNLLGLVEQTTTNYNCTTTSDVVQGIKDSMSTGIISDVKET